MLNVSGLTAGYGITRVIENLSFDVGSGEILAVCGPNGAGKSTLLRVLARQVRPLSGSVAYNGSSLLRDSPAKVVERGIALCPEGRRVFPRMSTEENLVIGGYARRDRDALQRDVEAYLEAWPVIGRRRSSPAGQLSGGEQQIVAIGRAMMSKPSLLLLDEPSLGLAPVLIDQVYEGLTRMVAETGISVLLVEQNVNKALELCDRIAVLTHGHIVFEAGAENTEADAVGAHYFAQGENAR